MESNTKPCKRAIKWDEETIAEHDKDRGTRQHISEPKTPYQPPLTDKDYREMGLLPELSSLQEKLEKIKQAREGDAGAQDELEEEEREKHHREFEEKRRMHYDEYKMVKAMREKPAEENSSEADSASSDGACEGGAAPAAPE